MKHHNTIGFLIVTLSVIISWLSFTILWAFIGDISYIECLRSPVQFAGLFFIYWWCPGIFILMDYSKSNRLNWFFEEN